VSKKARTAKAAPGGVAREEEARRPARRSSASLKREPRRLNVAGRLIRGLGRRMLRSWRLRPWGMWDRGDEGLEGC